MASSPTILIVEDDDQVREYVRTLLANENYQLLEARSGEEALKLASPEQVPTGIDLLLSDMLLPEVSGCDVALQLRDRFPAMKVILMTGYVEGEIVQKCIAELNATFLDKPFQPAVLRGAVKEALARASANAS